MGTNFGGLVELWGTGADGRAWRVDRPGWRDGWDAVVSPGSPAGEGRFFAKASPAAALVWVREVCG